MPGTCVDCVLCRPKERRWWGNHYGCGCAAVVDGVHELGWGKIKHDAAGNIMRKGALLDVTDCYYWQSVEDYQQVKLFEKEQ